MKVRNIFAWLAVPLLLVASAHADLTDVLQDTTSLKQTYAVFDIRPKDKGFEPLKADVLSAIRVYANDAKESSPLALNDQKSLPQMSFNKTAINGTVGHDPQCRNELFSILGRNLSYAKYGEISVVKACLFEYADGYRLDYFTTYFLKTTASSTQGLGSMLGRAIAGAVGLGDSSKFMVTAREDLERRIRERGYDIRLVRLVPQRDGVQVHADPAKDVLSQMAQGAIASSSTAGTVMPAAATQTAPAAMQPTNPMTAKIEARKNLTGMGLAYHSQEQFIASIRRKDDVAVQLFIDGAGVDLSAKEKNGKTPVDIANEVGAKNIAQLISSRLNSLSIPASASGPATSTAQPVPQQTQLSTKPAGATMSLQEAEVIFASLPPADQENFNAAMAQRNLTPEQQAQMKIRLAQMYMSVKKAANALPSN